MSVQILVTIAQEVEKISVENILKSNYRREGKRLRSGGTNIQWEGISNDDITKRKIDIEYIIYLHQKKKQNRD